MLQQHTSWRRQRSFLGCGIWYSSPLLPFSHHIDAKGQRIVPRRSRALPGEVAMPPRPPGGRPCGSPSSSPPGAGLTAPVAAASHQCSSLVCRCWCTARSRSKPLRCRHSLHVCVCVSTAQSRSRSGATLLHASPSGAVLVALTRVSASCAWRTAAAGGYTHRASSTRRVARTESPNLRRAVVLDVSTTLATAVLRAASEPRPRC